VRTHRLALLLPLALAATLPAGRVRAATLPPGFQDTVVLGGLVEPTAVRFSPDGRVFVAEKSGIIRVFDRLGADSASVFADLRTNVHNFFDRGLLGLALHPDFPATPYVYVLYVLDAPIGGTPPAYGTAGATSDGCDIPGACVVANRVSRLEAAGDAMTGAEQVLVEDWCQTYPSHSGGGLAFGPDGALYVSGGEGATAVSVDYGQTTSACGDPPLEGGALRAQDLRTPGDPVGLSGTVIRIDPLSGLALPDNPLAGAAGDRIIAYGLRNPFRLTTRPGTHELWIGDVGWEDWEEIDRIGDTADRTVENFGWPCFEGPVRQPGYESARLPICDALYADAGSGAVTSPFFAYRHEQPVVPGESCGTGDSAITGLAFHRDGNYPPPYDRALFVADYARNCIWAMPPGASGDPDPAAVTSFVSGAENPVDLQVGPGGDLFYVDIVGGTVRRIEYFPGNQPPLVVARADVTNGPLPLTVHFDGSSSRDPDSPAPLAYEWDLDGDGEYDDATEASPVYTYTERKTYTVRLRVTDADGASTTAALVIWAGNSAPRPTIDTPSASVLWSVGDVIRFSGSAIDPDDGPLPASALSWSLILHHCPADCHTHPLRDYPGVAGGAFTTLDHDYPSFLELRLTATDSEGLTASASLALEPRTVALGFASIPPGLELAVGTEREAAPFVRTAIAGSRTSVSAPSPQTLDGVTYEFVGWSDGGAASHDVVAPATPATYTARFLGPPGSSGCTGTCGDGIVDPPCELCDLGPGNCRPGECCDAGCTSDCRATGRCTGSDGCCVSAEDCPAGEGCCGNARVESPGETCDDGNRFDDDCCSARCQVEGAGCQPQTCTAVGPHLLAPARMTARIVDRGTRQRWSARGRVTLHGGQTVDPDSEEVDVMFARDGRLLYEEPSPPGTFRQSRDSCARKWTAARGEGLFRQPRAAGGKRGDCSGTVGFALAGRADGASKMVDGARLRESVRIGDDCVTAVLECGARGKTGKKRLRCRAR
jgi:glucose/arabinose dehydrogenase